MKLLMPTKLLLEASDYRGFLSILYKKNKDQNAAFSYAYMAKRCQFSSKSFLKEVIGGKKNLSLESAHKIAEGLDFPNTWKKYFLHLVTSAEQSSLIQKQKTFQKLERYKAKLKKQKTTFLVVKDSDLFQLSHWPLIYAALGDQSTGANIVEIQKRTGLKEDVIQATLNRLIIEKMVIKKGPSYFAVHETAFFENLAKSKFFKNFYLQSVERLFSKARMNFDSTDSLYFNMALSVDPKRMPEFKKSLAALLDEYTENVEEPNGSRVASLICGFHLM